MLIAPPRPVNDVAAGCEGPELNPIEKTIRNTLDKGDASDRAFREKVYRSVHAALERSLQASPDLSEETARQRREMLKASILSIETEFIPARAPTPAPAPAPIEREGEYQPEEEITADRVEDEREFTGAAVPAVEPVASEPDDHATAAPEIAPDRDEPETATDFPVIEPRTPSQEGARRTPEPGLRAPTRRSGSERREPSFGDDLGLAPPAADDTGDVPSRLQGERRDLPRRRGRFYAMAFLAVTLIAAIGMGVWWTVDQGLFLSAEQRDTSVPNPPLALENEEFVPEGTSPSPPLLGVADDTADWITIFDPSDPTQVSTPPGGEAAVIDSEYGPVLRIRASSADEPVKFDVGQGVLDQIAGRRAVFNVVAATEEGKPTQMSVTCDFGSLGDCGRNRYDVTAEQTDFLFDLDIPAGDPAGAGKIAIVSDVEDQGRAVDIRAIRVSIQD